MYFITSTNPHLIHHYEYPHECPQHHCPDQTEDINDPHPVFLRQLFKSGGDAESKQASGRIHDDISNIACSDWEAILDHFEQQARAENRDTAR